jgi:SAM-dependent methyltransferase
MNEGRCAICGAAAAGIPELALAGTDTGERFTIQRCRGCGVLRTAPVPADLEPYYTTDLAATMTRAGSTLFAALKLRRLRREARRLRRQAPSQRIVDIGCGTGDFALAARDAGFQVLAADAARVPPAAIRSQPGIAYARFDFESFDIAAPRPAGPYTVVLRHVLEHVRNPPRMLQRLREQGGQMFYIVVPNAASLERRLLGRHWYSWDPPRHLWHFDDATLDLACRRAGLTIAARGRATAPTLVPSLYRVLRRAGWPPLAYRPFAPNTLLTAITSPLNLLLAGNVLWRIATAAEVERDLPPRRRADLPFPHVHFALLSACASRDQTPRRPLHSAAVMRGA